MTNNTEVLPESTPKLDLELLTSAIVICFANARDLENYNTKQRTNWMVMGKILRGHHTNLLSAEFAKADFSEVQDANDALKKIVKKLRQQQSVLQDVNKTIKKLTKLGATLEKLIGLASSFV